MSAMPKDRFVGRIADSARRKQSRRKRGTTLIEAVLYISIATVVMVFSIGLMREEQVRRERTALAAELQQVTTAAQTFIAANYENIRDQLLDDTAAGSDMIMAYGMGRLVAQGYLPAAFVQAGTAPKSFVGSMQYGLAIRAVLRGDTGTSPGTQQRTGALTVPASSPPRFEPEFVDNIFQVDPNTGAVTNDEIDLEALLITVSSDPCVIVPAAHGPRIVSQSQTTAAGYVTGLGSGQSVPTTCSANVQSNLAWSGIEPGATALRATGPYGGWNLSLEPYANLQLTSAEFPNDGGQVFDGNLAVQAGRFASLLALQKRPPLSESAKIARTGDSALRCRGLPPNSQQELACRQNDLMYASLTFTSWDSNNDTVDDQFPGLLNVNTLDMAPPLANGAAQITDLLSLSCTTGNTVPTAPGRFTVDCPQTQMQGLVVTAAATFSDDVAVTGEVSAASATVANQLVVGGVSVPLNSTPLNSTRSASPANAADATAADGASGVTGDAMVLASAEANAATFLDAGASNSATEASDGISAAAATPLANTPTGQIILNGEDLAGKFITRLSHTFSGEAYLTVDKPICPSGLTPDILVLPVAFTTSEDLRGINTEDTSNGSTWRVKLLVTAEQGGNDDDVETLTNPTGSKIVVLTGCQ